MPKSKFLVSLTTNQNDYQIEQAQSAEQSARKCGVDVEVAYADNDAINQSTQILRAIQAAPEDRPDAIIFEPVGGTALTQVARAAVSSGIGWVVLNRDANYIPELRAANKAPVFCVTSDLSLRVSGIQIFILWARVSIGCDLKEKVIYTGTVTFTLPNVIALGYANRVGLTIGGYTVQSAI